MRSGLNRQRSIRWTVLLILACMMFPNFIAAEEDSPPQPSEEPEEIQVDLLFENVIQILFVLITKTMQTWAEVSQEATGEPVRTCANSAC